ncbi:signal peptidase I [bacterium]|nr:signal peptidase I [bacterium]
MKLKRYLVGCVLSVIGAVLLSVLFLGLGYFLWVRGVFELPVWVRVIGTSMEPTLINGQIVKFVRYLPNRPIHRGDIVAFSNEKTLDEKGRRVSYVKRVVALPGEEVLLRDGFITVNGKVLNEPYISLKKATYSESFLPECRKVQVPQDSYFVLGDNRMSSKDSRDFGFVRKEDIHAILYYQGPEITFSELEFKLSEDKIISLINQERRKAGVPALRKVSKLMRAAELRAQAIARYNDWTEGAKKSNFSYLDAIRAVNYKNILYGEIFDGGYLSSEDLIKVWRQTERVRKIYLDSRFQHIGVAVVMGHFGDCQVPVISVILGGYEPPHYSPELIQSWQNALSKLREIQPSWEALKENEEIYSAKKAEIDRICEIIALRIQRIERIVKRLQANEYLTEEEEIWMKEDSKLAEEQSRLAEEINAYIRSL